MFPKTLLRPTYADPPNSDNLVARSEVERRQHFIDQLHTQLGEKHPLAKLVKQCLHNSPSHRPSAKEVLYHLEGMRAQIQDPHEHLTKLKMMSLLTLKEGEVRKKEAELDQRDGQLRKMKEEKECLQLQVDVSHVYTLQQYQVQ